MPHSFPEAFAAALLQGWNMTGESVLARLEKRTEKREGLVVLNSPFYTRDMNGKKEKNRKTRSQ